jgi:fluoroquinolone resistance protein
MTPGGRRTRAEGAVEGTAIASDSRYGDVVFRGLDLEGLEVASSEFEDCRFVGLRLKGAEVRDCRFVECAFSECDLSLIRVPGSAFSACRFEDSKMIGVNWTEARWPEKRLWVPIGFERCVLNHSTFLGLDLRKVRVVGCAAHDVDFREADLTEASFDGTDLLGALFGGTNLTGADLSTSTNYRIDPSGNTLKGARFSLPEAISLLDGLDIRLTGWEP